MEKGVNDAGRGLNVIVIDGKTKKVTRRGSFDTYSEDSTQFEVRRAKMRLGNILSWPGLTLPCHAANL